MHAQCAGYASDTLCLCAERHYFWAYALMGYFCYDALYILYTGSAAGASSMLLHHALGLACCAVGLQGRMGYFGAAIQVIFEATTPLLHAAGCLRIMGLEKSRLYAVTGTVLCMARFHLPLC
jgi:hypothetical protein